MKFTFRSKFQKLFLQLEKDLNMSNSFFHKYHERFTIHHRVNYETISFFDFNFSDFSFSFNHA